MSHDIFISYSSEDKIVAEALSDCALMLLIFSRHSNGSKRVLDEIYFAISEEKTILPFRIENLDPTGAMRLHLSSRHWLDAYDPSWEAHINKLVDTGASILEKEVAPSGDLSQPQALSRGHM